MLAFDFDYYLPDTLQEATDVFDSVQKQGNMPLYYGGGTEIISMARVGNVTPHAVIDVKKIPECRNMGTDGAALVFGSARTLREIQDSGLFPLLGLAGGRIADHTIQCKLTLGGNLAGTIRYHEALLPLLLCGHDSHRRPPGKAAGAHCRCAFLGQKVGAGGADPPSDAGSKVRGPTLCAY